MTIMTMGCSTDYPLDMRVGSDGTLTGLGMPMRTLPSDRGLFFKRYIYLF